MDIILELLEGIVKRIDKLEERAGLMSVDSYETHQLLRDLKLINGKGKDREKIENSELAKKTRKKNKTDEE